MIFKRHVQYAVCVALCCLFGWTGSGICQKIKRHQIDIGTGIARYAFRSEAVSPLIHSGTALPLQASYRYNGDKNRHLISVFFVNNRLRSPYENTTNDIRGELQYGYHHCFTSLLSKIKLFGGALWSNSVSQRDNSFRFGITGNNRVTEAISSLNLSVLGVAAVKKDRLELHAWIPLLAYTIRSGYALRPSKEATDDSFLTSLRSGSFESVNRYFQFDARLAFVKHLIRQFELRLDYHFIYYKFSKPQLVTAVSNQLNFAFALSL